MTETSTHKPSMVVEINDHGVVIVRNARITGLTVSGALLIDAPDPKAGGFRIEVDDLSLVRLRHMIDLKLSQSPQVGFDAEFTLFKSLSEAPPAFEGFEGF